MVVADVEAREDHLDGSARGHVHVVPVEKVAAHLQRLLDAGFPTGEVAAKLAARAGSVRPVDLKPPTGRWSPFSGLRASPEKMPPLRWPRPPHDMPAQLITLSAVRGDMAMIGHLIPGNETNTYIQHLVLHCHWLASPWVAPEAAEQLFQRYSAEPALRREEGRHWPSHTGVHQDVIGAVTILVRILPKLQAMRVPFDNFAGQFDSIDGTRSSALQLVVDAAAASEVASRGKLRSMILEGGSGGVRRSVAPRV